MLAQVENSIVSHFSCKNVNIVTIGVRQFVFPAVLTVHECDRQIGVQTELPLVFFTFSRLFVCNFLLSYIK